MRGEASLSVAGQGEAQVKSLVFLNALNIALITEVSVISCYQPNQITVLKRKVGMGTVPADVL